MILLKNFAVLFIIFLQDALGQEEYLWCYECGTDIPGEPDCLVFSLASSWRPYIRKCPGDSVCVKTMSGWDTTNELEAVRGCTPKVSLNGAAHQDGCWTHTSSSTVTCYCTTNLCNASSTIYSSVQVTLIAMGSLLLVTIFHQC